MCALYALLVTPSTPFRVYVTFECPHNQRKDQAYKESHVTFFNMSWPKKRMELPQRRKTIDYKVIKEIQMSFE